jgi:dTDP-glucose 4,6-dehydratase
MKLLVTGGAGFIGSNFVYYWLSKYPNDEIRVVDALTYAGNIENLNPIIRKIKFFEADINDRQKVAEAMHGVDAVVHFAAESHVDRSIYDPAKYWHTNVHGTMALLEEAKKLGIKRFHHISTDEVYGELPLDSNEKFTEETPYSPRPDNVYALSKAEADNLVLDFAEKSGMFVTISNCSNNYGPRQFPEKYIPIIITNLIDGIKVPVHGDGRNVRDWIHVEDHVSAIDAILQKGKSGEKYLIGTENDRSNLYVAKRVVDLFGAGEEQINHVPDRHSNDRRYAINPEKITKELGWKPKYYKDDFDEGLRQTIEWYKNNQDLWRPLLEKHDTVSDSTGSLTAFISLDRVSGKTKFEFNNVKKSKIVGKSKLSGKDFIEENRIRFRIVMNNLENRKWYQSSSASIKKEIEKLGSDPSTFGYVEDLAGRGDQVNGTKILSLDKIEHADAQFGIYGIASWFNVLEEGGKRAVVGYYSWGKGPKSGSKILLLVKNGGRITHIALQRESKFATGAREYSLAGGFSDLNEGLLDFIIRVLERDMGINILTSDAEVSEIISLGRISPDDGMTNNKPTLYALVVDFRNNYSAVKEDEILEEDKGIVLWPVDKIGDLVNKCDDSYSLAAIVRSVVLGRLKMQWKK